MYSLLFTVGLRYNREAMRNFILTYAVLTKLQTKLKRKFYNSIFSLFSPKEKKKHGEPERYYVRICKQTRKTRGKTPKQRSQTCKDANNHIEKTSDDRRKVLQNSKKNAQEKMTKVIQTLFSKVSVINSIGELRCWLEEEITFEAYFWIHENIFKKFVLYGQIRKSPTIS